MPPAARRLRELSRNAIEDAYAQIISEARNQYTLGYSPQRPNGANFDLPQYRSNGRSARSENLRQRRILSRTGTVG